MVDLVPENGSRIRNHVNSMRSTLKYLHEQKRVFTKPTITRLMVIVDSWLAELERLGDIESVSDRVHLPEVRAVIEYTFDHLNRLKERFKERPQPAP